MTNVVTELWSSSDHYLLFTVGLDSRTTGITIFYAAQPPLAYHRQIRSMEQLTSGNINPDPEAGMPGSYRSSTMAKNT